MQWVSPTEKDIAIDTLEKRLWTAADQLRANSGLTAAKYSQPVLGIISLRFAEVRFTKRRLELEKSAPSSRRGSRLDAPTAYDVENVLYRTPNARFNHLLNLPEGIDVGKAVNDAMGDIEKHKSKLNGALPKTYQLFRSTSMKPIPIGTPASISQDPTF